MGLVAWHIHNCPEAEGCVRTIKTTPCGFDKACLPLTLSKKITATKGITSVRIKIDHIVVLAAHF